MIINKNIEKIQQILKYKFKDINNLEKCLIHPSVYLHKKELNSNNALHFERLEFLGDRVLGLVVASLLYNKFKSYNEGDLTKKFSYLVQRDFLFKIAIEIHLYDYLIFNNQKANNIKNKSILADSLESIIGSVFVDGGFENAYKFVKKLWSPYLDNLKFEENDPKTKLQEISQRKSKKLPIYKLIKKIGPSHSPTFTISLKVLNFNSIQSEGNSIREAEKRAAKKILKIINEK